MRKEAEICQANGAYYAAVAMKAAELEALLLCVLIKYPSRTEAALIALMPGQKKKKESKNQHHPFSWTFGKVLDVAFAAGWISEEMNKGGNIGGHLNAARNLIHPGGHLRDYWEYRVTKDSFETATQIAQRIINYLMDSLKRLPTETRG